MTNKKLQIWLPLLLSVVMVIGMWAGYKLQGNINWQNKYSAAASSQSVQEVLDLVKLKYVDTLNTDSLENLAIEVIMSRLDPHSVYIPPEELISENENLQGNFSGIGIEYQIINDTLTVVYVLESGPSHQAGIKSGDKILKADSIVLIGEKLKEEVLNYGLRGKHGSKVNLTVLQNGAIKQLTITRGNIPLPSLDAAYMAAPGVGYIKLSKFAETTYREFMDAATGLQKAGMKKMILDLRGNGGGLLQQATNIADELLPDGRLIVSTRGNHVKTREVRSDKPGIFEKGELILLIDAFSASASEVLAGALQDNDRGIIIGRRSFGKGLVQEQYDLDNGGAIRLTVERYYTPTGRSIQKPYTNGNNKEYQEELLERFHGGNMYVADSAHAKAFITHSGKKVFDGGGITPDIVLPYDTSLINDNVDELHANNFLLNFIFSIYQQEKKMLQQIHSDDLFVTDFTLPANVWPQLESAAAKQGINTTKIAGKTRKYLELYMKALLARYIWRSNGFFKVINAHDNIYQAALIEIKNK